jgi:ABC-type dipeptide/oligopeptide/nickel transport system permease subunit
MAEEERQIVEARRRGRLALFWAGLSRNKTALFGLAVIGLFIVVAVAAPQIAPHDPNETNLPNMIAGPSLEYPLGTDELGRCILSRIIYGARISLSIGLMVIAIGVGVGAPLGVASAYYGGKLDFLMQRLVDTMFAFPGLLLALLLVAVLGVGIQNVMVALGVATVPTYIRLVRGSALSVKEEQYVLAARATGSKNFGVMLKHILPNCLSPIIVQSTLHMGAAILMAAGLGFLGLGVAPPTPEWGAMLEGGRVYIRAAPHVCIFPGLAIFIVVLSFNLLGDGLRDALDPRHYR